MPEEKTLLLRSDRIKQKLERIAYEILENNYEEKEIILAGINVRGLLVAKKLSRLLKNIMDIEVQVRPLKVNAANPIATQVEIKLDENINGKVVVIVDDVANTGRTLLYATKPFLDYLPKKIQIAVLVDRKHKTYPICADYVGLLLATTIQEHITMEIDGEKITAVYLD